MTSLCLLPLLLVAVDDVPGADAISESVVSVSGYKDTTWGMSLEEVKARVPTGAWHESGMWVVSGQVAGVHAWTGYYFTDNKLSLVRIVCTEHHMNKMIYLSHFADLKGLLTAKYGKPAKDDTLWLKDTFRGSPREHGVALGMGHLIRFAMWDTDKTKVDLGVMGENMKIRLEVTYESKELAPVRRRQARETSMQDL